MSAGPEQPEDVCPLVSQASAGPAAPGRACELDGLGFEDLVQVNLDAACGHICVCADSLPQRHLGDAAKKAMGKLTTRTVKKGDKVSLWPLLNRLIFIIWMRAY